MGQLWLAGLSLQLIVALVPLIGALLGAVNGLFVTRFGLPSLAVTIGTLALYRGLAFVVLGDRAVADFPFGWTQRARSGPSPVRRSRGRSWSSRCWPWCSRVVLHDTPIGRGLYAIGNNDRGGDVRRHLGRQDQVLAVRGQRRRLRAGRHLLDPAVRQRPRRQRRRTGTAGGGRRAARRRVHLRRSRHAGRGARRGAAARHRTQRAATGRRVHRHPDRGHRRTAHPLRRRTERRRAHQSQPAHGEAASLRKA